MGYRMERKIETTILGRASDFFARKGRVENQR